MKYRVLSITNNPPKYPEIAMDSAEFPELVEDVEDEQELFIMDETGTFYKANWFFYTLEVKEFSVP
jgi:hypothetical protein